MIKRIGILTSSKTWTLPYCRDLQKELEQKGYFVSLGYAPDDLEEPLDVVCILSYNRILPGTFLEKHRHNLVVHASDLPKGRGWSPLNWQILNGSGEITLTLFEAEETMDTGVIYLQEKLHFQGNELLEEMLEKEGQTINSMILHFLKDYDDIVKQARPQLGEPTFYERRRPEHSELDIDKTIRDQFNLLRIVDNERYPAFFRHQGNKYILKIYKDKHTS